MKKKLFVLLAAMVLVFSFSVTCFAKESPTASVLPRETEKDDPGKGGGNKSDKSPQTGVDIAAAFVAVITAAGVVLVSKKKYSEAE